MSFDTPLSVDVPLSFDIDIDVAVRRGDRDVQCAFAAGPGVTVLVGPSGAGKTSVLHMIAGLLRPDRGHVRIGDMTLFDASRAVDVAPELRCAGYVFQDLRLFPHLRVRDNLRYGRRVMPADRQVGFPPCERRVGRDQVVTLLDIAHLLGRWPRSLSGGEARRVAIARALLSDPAFLLLDEPLSSLDPRRKEEATRVIERVRDETGLPILLVTHDRGEATRIGNRIVEMPSVQV